MAKETKDKLVKTIEVLVDKSTGNIRSSDEALKFTQAALNVAHTILTLQSAHSLRD